MLRKRNFARFQSRFSGLQRSDSLLDRLNVRNPLYTWEQRIALTDSADSGGTLLSYGNILQSQSFSDFSLGKGQRQPTVNCTADETFGKHPYRLTWRANFDLL